MMITKEYELFTIAVVDFVFFERERKSMNVSKSVLLTLLGFIRQVRQYIFQVFTVFSCLPIICRIIN